MQVICLLPPPSLLHKLCNKLTVVTNTNKISNFHILFVEFRQFVGISLRKKARKRKEEDMKEPRHCFNLSKYMLASHQIGQAFLEEGLN